MHLDKMANSKNIETIEGGQCHMLDDHLEDETWSECSRGLGGIFDDLGRRGLVESSNKHVCKSIAVVGHGAFATGKGGMEWIEPPPGGWELIPGGAFVRTDFLF